jgi:SAM-dependent methyltransferase
MIDPRDVMRRFTVEELCQTADEYFQRISDPTPLMVKPFAFLHEAPEMLQNLGLLLSGLSLGKTMTVLDFGAGTCWLSRFLAQLSCQPICCDASPAALAIGRRLFAEYPPFGPAVYQPTFLPFDGHTIDLEDGAVDRIVCFDAFHHLPNQQEVVAELARVLKRGGIAGFSEPGRRHSQSPQSQYEMSHHRVLENDIDLNEISAYALAAGFTSLAVKVATDMTIALDDYNRIFDGRDKAALSAELWNQTHNTMFNRSVFFLHKGPVGRDSRGHVGLAHRLIAGVNPASGEVSPYAVAPGAPLQLRFTMTNTGEAVWLHRNSEIFGIVRLASHLYLANGRLVEHDYSRHDLPQDVAPGETLAMTVELMLPRESGDYELVFDLVAEGVTWFENVGATPVRLRARVD